MKTNQCRNEDDCPTPMWCRGKDKCPRAKEPRKIGWLARLVVRWAVLGWWLVPMLWLLRAFAEMNESYWSGDATEIYWHRDDSMVALRKWSGEKLEAFLQHNAKDLARRAPDSE